MKAGRARSRQWCVSSSRPAVLIYLYDLASAPGPPQASLNAIRLGMSSVITGWAISPRRPPLSDLCSGGSRCGRGEAHWTWRALWKLCGSGGKPHYSFSTSVTAKEVQKEDIIVLASPCTILCLTQSWTSKPWKSNFLKFFRFLYLPQHLHLYSVLWRTKICNKKMI